MIAANRQSTDELSGYLKSRIEDNRFVANGYGPHPKGSEGCRCMSLEDGTKTCHQADISYPPVPQRNFPLIRSSIPLNQKEQRSSNFLGPSIPRVLTMSTAGIGAALNGRGDALMKVAGRGCAIFWGLS